MLIESIQFDGYEISQISPYLNGAIMSRIYIMSEAYSGTICQYKWNLFSSDDVFALDCTGIAIA